MSRRHPLRAATLAAPLALLAALSLGSAPALAKKKDEPVFVEAASVPDKPVVAFKPDKAYILVRSERPAPMHLMKMPSPEDQATWDRLRAEALTEAREKYAKKKERYDRELKSYEGMKKSGVRAVKPEEPVEPTEANFEFTPFPLLTGVNIGPLFRFAKGEGGASTYLHEVTPGEYRVYGLISALPGVPIIGACYCMGSVAFTAKAGEITDVGYLDLMTPKEAEAMLEAGGTPPPIFKPAPAGMIADPRLAKYTVTSAKFRAVGKLPNYFGIAIDRIPPMPGVIAYDRDRIIDLAAGN